MKSTEPTAIDSVVIHFAGDSGDGMQLMGQQFTQTSANMGNDVQTFSDFPAEIRAPQGTIPGVSGFQLMFSKHDIHTPGDCFDTLVAMNPAALKVSLAKLKKGGILIVDSDKFLDKDLKKANYESNPLEDGSLADYRVLPIALTTLTLEALKDSPLSRPKLRKCKNMYALGVVYWLYQRDVKMTSAWLANKFKSLPDIANINQTALEAGFTYAQNIELFNEYVVVPPADLKKGTYKQITGNEAISYAAVMASLISQTPLLMAGYPITPASDILHLLSHYREQGVLTFQAEDEIAAIGAAIGAAFGGQLAMTTTSGPGMDLKSEAMGLAVMAELPLVIVDVQRAGPSTGMPTKVEQSDLLMARFGRHGECPLPILAASSPKDCFDTLLMAFKIAVEYMTPVIVLSDGYLANSSEPWEVPDANTLPSIEVRHHKDGDDFAPYQRNTETLTRKWAIPGTKGCEHRIGGLEKQDGSGNISYDPKNHQLMTETRAQKVDNVAQLYPPLNLIGNADADTLILSWGGTKGEVRTAVERCCKQGLDIAMCHLTHLHPFHRDLKALLSRYSNILVVELNCGQLCQLIRAEFLVPAKSITKMAGQPFQVQELVDRIVEAVPNHVE